MKYISTRKNDEKVTFKEAVINGLTTNGGLYFPETIPTLPSLFFENIEALENNEIAFQVLKPFVEESLSDEQLRKVISETLSFPTPLAEVSDRIYSLELFHGPTKAFKDVGARFMSRCLSHFYAGEKDNVTILVATSGDTGSAVASGFYNVDNVNVKVLFPKGKVSPYQEYQMTSMGKNIAAIEVDGVFDDCQKLVKEAFNDTELRSQVTLSSANSINVARLLPQMLYYFFAYKELKTKGKADNIVFSVPSGNLGNITAGLVAQKLGLPVHKFIAALNANDTFLQYLNNGAYYKKASVPTCSNAMDVGDPSNFERINYMYNKNVEAVREHIRAYSFDDTSTLKEIKVCKDRTGYVLCPHGAVGKLALEEYINNEDLIGVFLGTAHPQKFSEVIQRVLPAYDSVEVDLSTCQKISISNSYTALREIVLG